VESRPRSRLDFQPAMIATSSTVDANPKMLRSRAEHAYTEQTGILPR
jgi:hypothetical protein